VFRRFWLVARWVFVVLVFFYIALVLYSYPHDHKERIAKTAVSKIETQKLTMDDVDGSHLPPPFNPNAIDATLVGIDANGNGIRDDVELAIFAAYPTSTVIRAAELQYAMELQMEFTDVFDSTTLVAVLQQEGRGYLCISNDVRAKEVEAQVFNTKEREEYREGMLKKYMTSFGTDPSEVCDVQL